MEVNVSSSGAIWNLFIYPTKPAANKVLKALPNHNPQANKTKSSAKYIGFLENLYNPFVTNLATFEGVLGSIEVFELKNWTKETSPRNAPIPIKKNSR